MNHKGPSAIQDILDCPFSDPVGLRHRGLGELMYPSKTQVLHGPNDLVSTVRIDDIRADYSQEVLQRILSIQSTLTGDQLGCQPP